MTHQERKLNYIAACNAYVTAEKTRKKRLKICDTVLKIAATIMAVAALYVIQGH